jgi:PAS domain S-box-containing protein
MTSHEVLEHAPVLIWSGDRDGRCEYVNAAWRAYTGRTLEDERGDGWREGVHPEDREACLTVLQDGIARCEPLEVELRLRGQDATYRPMLLRAVRRDGGFVATCSELVDTHSGTAFFDMSLDLLCVAGFDGYWKRLNPSWERTLGWTPAELMSRPLIEFCHPEDRDATLAGRERLKVGEPLRTLTNRYRCKDGTYRWFEWRSASDIERRLVYASARDVTAQKAAERAIEEARQAQERLERRLEFADRMASVGTLAAGVAHEINNPLAYVSTNLEMLIEELSRLHGGSFAELIEMARDARQGAERIRKIVRRMKTFSRGENERRAVIDVRPVLELAIDMAFNEIRHRARLAKDFGDLPLVEADDSRLGQVFINLLVNAAQAVGDGDGDGNEIRVVTSTDASGRAVIEVHDTGPGIPPHQLDKIFEPFFTTKPVGVGTGLGLSICHYIVTSMSGQITAENRAGRGAVFRVTLPGVSVPALPSAPDPVACPATSASRRARILVIDDERSVCAVLARLLRDHDVTAVASARDALELLADGNTFDVIFSDLMMPEMSGVELYEEIVRRRPELASRIVFMTGGAFTPQVNRFLDQTTNPRLEKPFAVSTVRAIVERFIGSSP